MKRKIIIPVLIGILAGILGSCRTVGSNGPAQGNLPEAMQFVQNMGLGWNLGNTLEACGDYIDKSSIRNFETAWGNPVTTKEMFDGLKAVGIRSVRIPVAWSNLMAADYTIHPDLMQRVEDVVGYALANGMYAVVNIHWDGGWINKFSTAYDECMKKYKSIWTQVCARFKNTSEKLVFESMNEEGCFDDIWNRWGGASGVARTKAYNLLNTINQEFVNLVRAAGGKNSTRYLLIAGYATDIDLTCDENFRMPDDAVKHTMLSLHYYTPSQFTILEEDASWGMMLSTWGSYDDIAILENYIDIMKTHFIEKGIPVILGEYGAPVKNKDPESVFKYISEVTSKAYAAGICPMLWDPGLHYDRNTTQFKDPQVAEMYKMLVQSERETIYIAAPAIAEATPAPAPQKTEEPKTVENKVLELKETLAGGNMEDASAWKVSNLDSQDIASYQFNYTEKIPANGKGGCLRVMANVKQATNIIFWQELALPGGAEYEVSGAFADLGGDIKNFWCEILIGAEAPPAGTGVDYGGITALGFNTWDGTKKGVDGTFRKDSAKGKGPVYKVPGEKDVLQKTYFVINVGVWAGGASMPFDVAIDEIGFMRLK